MRFQVPPHQTDGGWQRGFCRAVMPVFVLAGTVGLHAQAVLKGHVLENGPGGLPVANVQILVDNIAVWSESNGIFRVAWETNNPGTTVTVTPIPPLGHSVVNGQDFYPGVPVVSASSADSKPLWVFLCRSERVNEMRRRYFAIKHGLKSAQALQESYNHALALHTSGKQQEALSVLEDAELAGHVIAAITIRDIPMKFHTLRAQILTNRFELGDADNAFSRAIEAASSNFAPYHARGALRHRRNQPDEALNDYQKALELAREADDWEDVAKVYESLGDLHRDEKRPLEARSAFEEALVRYRSLAATSPEYGKDSERIAQKIQSLK